MKVAITLTKEENCYFFYAITRLCHFIKSKSSKNIVFINVFGRLIQNNTTYVNVPKRS